ncbi:HlyC/CorC family transporter [Methylomonas montana]|uniref:HlyC/CorC family transporter n=1 Tax=Methylomonas montana TaxID=3058963 RepID=UPI002657DDC4|nr:HlyC/CorC family transporter [Methylomonas montana]WKJ88715.1 HlyC/CorC family transporter [Methylomonas montana]
MNDISLNILFGILAALLIISAFFSGSETALMTLNRYRLQHLVKKNHKGAIKTLKLLKKPDRLIGLILLGNNFVNILASSLTTLIAIRIGGDNAIAPAIALLTIGMLIFSEVTPKTLGALRPEFLAFLSSWVYIPLLKIFYPVVWAINIISSLLLRIFGINGTSHRTIDSLNKDELKSIVSEANHLMPARYQNMLLSILDLESASVADIMTHRNDIIGIDLEDSIEDIVKQLQNSPHTRLPVYKKNIDRVIGFLHLRTILSQISDPDFDKHSITNSLSKPFFIPASTSIHKQMQIFKAEKLRTGLVVDEYGDVLGLVTLDDLLQEIVGELILEEPDIKMQKDGSYLVDASVTIRELNRVTQWELPTEGPKTLNGLIIEYMETIPEPGTSVKLHGHVMEIIKRDENTIKLVKFNPKR